MEKKWNGERYIKLLLIPFALRTDPYSRWEAVGSWVSSFNEGEEHDWIWNIIKREREIKRCSKGEENERDIIKWRTEKKKKNEEERVSGGYTK